MGFGRLPAPVRPPSSLGTPLETPPTPTLTRQPRTLPSLSTSNTLPPTHPHFDLLILSDLLWLHDEHTSLLHTISHTLSPTGTAWFTAGHYSKRPVVDGFFDRARTMGLESEEV